MQILFVNQYFPPDTSATAYLIGELAEDLTAADEQVTVLAGAPSYGSDAGSYRPRGVTVLRVPSTTFSRSRMWGRLLNYITYIATAFLVGLVRRRPDVIVGMTDPPLAGVVAALLGARHSAPFVFVCFDLFPHTAIALGRVRSRASIHLWHRLNVWLWRRAEAIVVVARDMKTVLEEHGVPEEKITFIPNWANDVSVNEADVREWRERHGWQDRMVVMHAGNMGLAQGLDTAVEAAEQCRDRQDVLFVFLGEGAAKKALEARVRNQSLSNVQFLPHVSKEEARVAIAAADLHLVMLAPGVKGSAAPSKLYGILAAGKPFIASVEPGTEPALVAEEFRAGVLVPPGMGAPLAAAVRSVDRGALNAMGTRARRAFETRYERAVATAAYRDVLNHTHGSRR